MTGYLSPGNAPMFIYIGLCLPRECDAQELEYLTKVLTEMIREQPGMESGYAALQLPNSESMYAYDTGTYIAIILVSIIGILVFGGFMVENTKLFGSPTVELSEENLEEYD